MEELYTPHEGTYSCPVCAAEVSISTETIKYVDPKNQEEFFFDSSDCYQQFIQNPEKFMTIHDGEEEE